MERGRGHLVLPGSTTRTPGVTGRGRARTICAMRTPRTAAVLVPLMLLALGCAPQASSTATATNPSQSPAACAQGKTMKTGVLTVGTDSPAYPPWFLNNKPSNGKGYE